MVCRTIIWCNTEIFIAKSDITDRNNFLAKYDEEIQGIKY